MSSVPPDRLRELLDLVLETLDEGLSGRSLAGRAYLSRFHFDRLIKAGVDESPAAFRRRLLLERAAWSLQRSASVTEAGLEAGYASTEAFSRAFSRAFGVAPRGFQGAGRDFRIEARNGVHFHPPGGLLMPGNERSRPMDATDRLLEHDRWLTERLLERAGELTDDQLDREIRPGHEVLSFDGPEPTVRAMLDRLIWTKEVWVAAMTGADFPDEPDRDLEAMRRRFAAAGEEFVAVATRVRERNGWNDVFVDGLCDPPQSFSFGGVIAHVITFSAHRRQVLLGALEDLGLGELEPNCPIEWERRRAAERALPAASLRGTDS